MTKKVYLIFFFFLLKRDRRLAKDRTCDRLWWTEEIHDGTRFLHVKILIMLSQFGILYYWEDLSTNGG